MTTELHELAGSELPVPGLARLMREVAATAPAVDANELPATTHLSPLAEQGLLDLGIEALLQDPLSPEARDVRAVADVIASLAEECMPTAFSTWAHRMVLEYFARGTRSPEAMQALHELRRAQRTGCTAMAAGLKSLAGIGELSITAVPAGDGWTLDGRITWASNLVDGAIVVLPARTATGTMVVWLDIDTPGFAVRHVEGLLALDATASGTVQLSGVRVRPHQVLSTDLQGFAKAFRPGFLILQSAFCAGIIRRSLAETENALDRADNAVFAPQVAALRARVDDFLSRWNRLAGDTASGRPRDHLELRLDGSHLACQVTRLEATLAGGRGYLTSSAASRRFREAAFLPVQSPSEGHLTWELSLLDSTESTPATGRAAS